MSKYTTEVRFICENYAGLKENGQYPVQSVVEKAAPLIFENFPIFDENYRLVLETKILRHYYTREICAETVGLWKLWLNNTMIEIMPYFNKLYETELLKFDPLTDTNYTRSYNRKEDEDRNANINRDETGATHASTDGTSTDNTATTTRDTSNSDTENTERTTRTNDHFDRYAKTPQGSISGEPIFTNYLTDARNITDEEDISRNNSTINNTMGTGNSSSDSTATTRTNTDGTTQANTNQKTTENASTLEDYLETLSGKRGMQTYSTMLKEFRETLLNIDMLIIERLSDLFMNIY